MITVYLAGGMKTDWRHRLKGGKNFMFYDPCDIKDGANFTIWDLAAIDNSNIVFAYLEMENTQPIGMMLELGYAKAQGKYIILCDEWNDNRTTMARHMSNFSSPLLSDCIKHLRSM